MEGWSAVWAVADWTVRLVVVNWSVVRAMADLARVLGQAIWSPV